MALKLIFVSQALIRWWVEQIITNPPGHRATAASALPSFTFPKFLHALSDGQARGEDEQVLEPGADCPGRDWSQDVLIRSSGSWTLHGREGECNSQT